MTTDLATLKQMATDLAPLSASPTGTCLTPQGLNIAAASEVVNELIWIKENPPAPEVVKVEVPVRVEVPVMVPAPRVSTAPKSDLHGWKLSYVEDFDKPADYGQIAKVYGTGMRGYSGFQDTYKKGTYDPDKVLSVPAGSSYLDIWLRTVDGKPRIACPIPINYEPYTYGRFDVRYRADIIPGYKIAWMQWPSSNNWNDGEIDFPEHDLAQPIGGYSHDVNGTPSRNAMWVKTKVPATDWHIATVEWTPEYVMYLLDGGVIAVANKASGGVPTKPMRWTLQCETKLDNTPVPADSSGRVQIDWLAAYRYVAR